MQHTVGAVMYYDVFSLLLDDVQRLDLILAVNCFAVVRKFKKEKRKKKDSQTDVFKETFKRLLPTAMAELKLFTRL